MASKRSSARVFFYLLISVIIPVAMVLINHIYWIDNIMLSVGLLVWMGFALLVIQPYPIGDYKTTEP